MEGWKYIEISEFLKISKQTISSVLKKRISEPYYPKSGRPKIKTDNKMRVINAILKAHRQRGVRRLTAEAKCPWSKSTTYRRLKAARWRNKKIPRRPILSPEQKEERKKFAEEHLVERTDFEKVVFSDEKKFRFDGPDGWHKYWFAPNEPATLDCFSRDYGRYKGVMVWLAISSAGILHVERVRGKLDAAGYADMVCGDACAHIHKAHGMDFTLQQDNAPPHRAQLTQATFEAAGIKTLPWPALSPDLNPVENVWAMIVRRLYADGRHYNSEDELWAAIQETVQLIPAEDIKKLVAGVPRRLTALLERKGEYAQ
jgi:hypothetical protein